SAVLDFRKRCLDNGYKLIRVRTGSKLPLVKQWPHGEAEDQLLAVDKDALSTGLLTAGLRCVDIDVDDFDTAQLIVTAVCRHLPPGALRRRRSNTCRFALIYRAADGQPGKQFREGLHGKVEVLGAGQQVVVDGVHPAGNPYYFKTGRGPDTVP